MGNILNHVRHLIATGDGWALTDEEIEQAIEAAGRIGDYNIVNIVRLSKQRADRAAYNAENNARLLLELKADHVAFIIMAKDLVREIEAEEKRAGCHDPSHYAYPTFCAAARIRLKTIHQTIDDVVTQIADLEGRVAA